MKIIDLFYEIAKGNIKVNLDNPFVIKYKNIKYSYIPYVDWFDNEWKWGFVCEEFNEDFNKELCISDLSELNDEVVIINDNRK